MIGTTIELKVTGRAAARIRAISGAEGKALRLAVNGGGCSGFQYEFTLTDQRMDGDVVTEHEGATVLVDSISLPFLTGSTLDFVDDLMGQSFRVVNPQAKSSCGCGTSFSV